jgi:hypothetical protein
VNPDKNDHRQPKVCRRVGVSFFTHGNYLVSRREAGRVKTRLIKKLLAALNTAPDRVMFPAGGGSLGIHSLS